MAAPWSVWVGIYIYIYSSQSWGGELICLAFSFGMRKVCAPKPLPGDYKAAQGLRLVHALGPQKVIEGGFGGSSLEPRDESTWQEWEAFSAGSSRPRGRF